MLQGCVPELEVYLKKQLIILGAVGLGICCLQVCVIIMVRNIDMCDYQDWAYSANRYSETGVLLPPHGPPKSGLLSEVQTYINLGTHYDKCSVIAMVLKHTFHCMCDYQDLEYSADMCIIFWWCMYVSVICLQQKCEEKGINNDICNQMGLTFRLPHQFLFCCAFLCCFQI